MRRSQPASQDSEDADTVATADCSRWRPVSAPQPWWAMEPAKAAVAAQPTEAAACVLAQPLG